MPQASPPALLLQQQGVGTGHPLLQRQDRLPPHQRMIRSLQQPRFSLHLTQPAAAATIDGIATPPAPAAVIAAVLWTRMTKMRRMNPHQRLLQRAPAAAEQRGRVSDSEDLQAVRSTVAVG